MGCERYEPHLTAYLDDELSNEARGMMERHLAECGSCREALAELEATRQVMQQWKDAEVGEEFLESMRERMRQERHRERRTEPATSTEVRRGRRSRTVVTVGETGESGRPGRRLLVKIGLAATVLVGAGVGLLVLSRMGVKTTGERPMSVAAAREMVAKATNVRELRDVAVATETFVAAQVRKERPTVKGVIGAETVQLFLETARVEAQQRHLEVLLGPGAEVMLAREEGGSATEALAQELGLWMRAGVGSRAYGQEMTVRTETALADGLMLERLGKYEEAIEAYGKVQSGTHERAVALVRKAGLLIRLGRFKEAGEALGSAESGPLGDEVTKKIAGRLTRRVELAREASGRVEELKRGLAERPDDVKGWRELADLELGCGNYAGASAALTGLAKEVTGDERDMVRFRAAWCEKNTGAYEKALGEIESLRRQESLARDVRMLCMFESADILYRCGRYAQSIDAHKVLIGYPGELDDASRALLILRVGYVQYYDLSDTTAAKTTLEQLKEARYRETPAGKVAEMMLQSL